MKRVVYGVLAACSIWLAGCGGGDKGLSAKLVGTWGGARGRAPGSYHVTVALKANGKVTIDTGGPLEWQGLIRGTREWRVVKGRLVIEEKGRVVETYGIEEVTDTRLTLRYGRRKTIKLDRVAEEEEEEEEEKKEEKEKQEE